MNIKILHMIEGAKQATGCAVIIDVFRAFTVEVYLMNNGADKIIPVGEKQIAYDLKKDNSNYVLIGERHGVVLPGFDYGNSPSQIENVDFSNKTIVHTTSAGTQGIANADNATEILTGSLVNAKAIAEYIKRNDFEEVSLVCMGYAGARPAAEDELCAEYIKRVLEGSEFPDFKLRVAALLNSGGKHFFDKTRQDIFPQDDFWMCTRYNRFPFVIQIEKDDYGFVGRKISVQLAEY